MFRLVAATIFLWPNLVLAKIPNDPEYAKQAAMWQQIHAPEAWDITTRSSNVVVAIIDTGSDYTHPDLAANIWTNPYEILENGIDDDNNGYIDDVHGWNFVENNNSPSQVNVGTVDPDAVRHSAIGGGLVGAVGDNNRDGVGISWQVKLMLLRTIDSSGLGSYSDVVKAVNYAVDNGADVISLSFVGDGFDQDLYEAIVRANKAGVFVVAAAGNDQTTGDGNLGAHPLYPVCFNSESDKKLVLGVGSVAPDDSLSFFSNFGSCVGIYAPGENIFSTEWFDASSNFNEEFGGPWRGTSYATPIVAGAAALIKSVRPAWTPQEIYDALVDNADQVINMSGVTGEIIAAKRLNIARALLKAKEGAGKNLPIDSIYYNGKTELWRYSVAGKVKSFLASYYDGKIIGIAIKPGEVVRKEEVAVLLNRGNYYYLKIVRGDGHTLKEIALPFDLTSGWEAKKIDWARDYSKQEYFVQYYSKKSKQTKLLKINAFAEVVAEQNFPGVLSAAALLKGGASTVAAILNKRVLQLRETDWQGNELNHFTLTGVDKIVEFKTAAVFGGDEDQVILIIQVGKLLKQYIVDLPSQSYYQEALGAFNPKKSVNWRILVGSDAEEGKASILRYTLEGGKFPIFSEAGTQKLVVNLPVLLAK